MEDQVVEEEVFDFDEDESLFQDVDILQNHGIVSKYIFPPCNICLY